MYFMQYCKKSSLLNRSIKTLKKFYQTDQQKMLQLTLSFLLNNHSKKDRMPFIYQLKKSLEIVIFN